MKTWYRYFYEIVSVLLFCSALTLLFLEQKQLTAAYRIMQQICAGDKILYKTEGERIQSEPVTEKKKVSKPELIGILTAEFSYDVEIDGEYFKKEEFTPLLFDFNLLSSSYLRSYVFDKKDGRIVSVKYQREGS